MSALRGELLTKWLPVAVGMTLLVTVVSQLHARHPGPDARRLAAFDFAPAPDGAQPPSGASDYAPRTLPHDWAHVDPRTTNAWYRTTFRLERVPGEPFGIYLPSVQMNAAVYVNGARVGDGGRFRDPVARNWLRPLYFTVPDRLLQSGENTLHVRVKADRAGNGLLGPIWLGGASALRGSHALRHHLTVTARQVFAVALLVVGVLMTALSVSPVAGPMYRWFGALSLMLALHVLNALAVEIPVSTRWWSWGRMIAMGWFSICITFLVHRFTETHRPGIERALLLGGALASVGMALVPEPWLSLVGLRLWDTAALTLGVYPTTLMFLHVLRRRELEVLAVLASGAALMIFGTHDLLMLNGLWPRENGFYIHYAAPLVTLVIAWMLLSRFTRALGEAKRLNQELEARVAAREAALEENHGRLRALERERVLAAERERIMRDIHDGVGGTLASALVTAEDGQASPGELATALREGLDDLRLMVHSLDPAADDLTALLGQLRGRLAPRLAQRDVRLVWRIGDVPSAAPLGPEGNLQVLRVVQEAVNNALRHSGASTLTLATGEVDARSVVEVADDGCGIGGAAEGNGLANMRARAERIGGRLEVESDAEGTRVRLWLPRHAPGPEAVPAA